MWYLALKSHSLITHGKELKTRRTLGGPAHRTDPRHTLVRLCSGATDLCTAQGDRGRPGRCRKEQALQRFARFPTASYRIAAGSRPFLPLFSCAHSLTFTSRGLMWFAESSPWLRSRTSYMPQFLSRLYRTGPQLCNKMETTRLPQLACISPPFWAFCLKHLGSHPTCSRSCQNHSHLPSSTSPQTIRCWFHHVSIFRLFEEVFWIFWN